MGKRLTEISDKLKTFIEQQKIFFVGTALADGRVNLSPKGLDALRVIDQNRVIWLNVTGSGNETAAHVQENPRMTLMFMSLSGDPLILRLYGTAQCIHKGDEQWQPLYSAFPDMAGARQIFDMKVDLVQTSCGMAVPYFDFVEERDQLNKWATKRGEPGIQEYWKENNQVSLDGLSTHILDKST